MTVSRPARIWGLVAAQAARRGGRASAADACAAAVAGGPVLASDLGARETACRWPAFASAACRGGAAAAFAFPLRIGGIRAGVMGLYRDGPGRLSDPAG
jgi:hypothetical protein